jgi:hypothetical protein
LGLNAVVVFKTKPGCEWSATRKVEARETAKFADLGTRVHQMCLAILSGAEPFVRKNQLHSHKNSHSN